MAASRRRVKELEEIRKRGLKHFCNIQVDDADVLTWQGLVVPDSLPYEQGAFRVEISFSAEYPFKPPKATFKTKIYHPNVDEKGRVCLPAICADSWKPATDTQQAIQALEALVNDPQPEHPLRADLAEEDARDRAQFRAKAEEFTRRHAEQRSSGPWTNPAAGGQRARPRAGGGRRGASGAPGNGHGPPPGVCVWPLLTSGSFLNHE